jgi:hypothetical protein
VRWQPNTPKGCCAENIVDCPIDPSRSDPLAASWQRAHDCAPRSRAIAGVEFSAATLSVSHYFVLAHPVARRSLNTCISPDVPRERKSTCP